MAVEPTAWFVLHLPVGYRRDAVGAAPARLPREVSDEIPATAGSSPKPSTERRVASDALDILSPVPTISRFYGIVIRMYFADHAPPHFHAIYGGDEAVIAIATLEILRGSLPDRAARMVREWASIHRDELAANWERTQIPDQPVPIDPLP